MFLPGSRRLHCHTAKPETNIRVTSDLSPPAAVAVVVVVVVVVVILVVVAVVWEVVTVVTKSIS
jgi:hypothetical protein